MTHLNLKNKKIAWKLTLFTLLFSTLITLAITLVQLYIDYNNGLRDISEQLHQVESGYRGSLEHGLWVDDREQLQLQINGILNLPDIKYVQLILNGGGLITQGKKLETAFINKEFTLHYQYKDRRLPVGTAIIMADLQRLYAELFDKAIIILFSQGTITFFTCFFILFLVQYLIIRHLETIAQFSTNLNLEHNTKPLQLNKKYHNDELDEVVHAFNLMQTAIKKEIENLALLNEELEDRVKNRTHELQASLDELKIAQKQLVQSEKMAALGGLVAGVAHEINTPVGLSITGITHIMDCNKQLWERYQSQLMEQSDFENHMDTSLKLHDTIYTNLKRAAELIKSFKLVAAVQSSEEMQTFSLKHYIDRVLLSVHNRLKITQVEVQIDCDKDLHIYSEPGAIVQIFTNLILNSLIHGFDENTEGVISIKVMEKDNEVEISYSDTGKGIKADVLPKIFDPFFTTNRKAGGTGLGLHIIYNIIVSQLGGNIEAHSQTGRGVTFDIHLPKQQHS